MPLKILGLAIMKLCDQEGSKDMDHWLVEIGRYAQKNQRHDDQHSITLNGMEKSLYRPRQNSRQNSGTIQRRDRNEIEHSQDHVDEDSVKRDHHEGHDNSSALRQV